MRQLVLLPLEYLLAYHIDEQKLKTDLILGLTVL